MATNPSDLTNVLNEMLGSLNKLSDSQREATRLLTTAQEKNLDKTKKLLKVVKNTVDQANLFEPPVKEKKTKKPDSLMKTVSDLFKKIGSQTIKPEQNKKDVIKKPSVFGTKISNSTFIIKGNLSLNSKSMPKIMFGDSKKQSSENYNVAEESPMNEEIKLLKSIESKLGSASSTGPGLFDQLFGGIGSLIKMFVSGSSAEVGGLLGGMFGLSKFGKLKNLLKPIAGIKKGLPKLASAGKLLKNPKLLIPALIIGSVGTIWTSMKLSEGGFFTKPLDQIGNVDELNAEQREKGGPVTSGKPYIVGERGPELFTPRESGRIVPNDKLGTENSTFYTDLIQLYKDSNKRTNRVFDYFVDKVKKIFDFLAPSNILAYVKKFITGVKEKVGGAVNAVFNFGKEQVSSAADVGKGLANKASNILGFGNVFSPTPTETTPRQPSRSHRIGAYSVPSDGPSLVHKNEMIVPAAQAEALRVTAKLNNQNVNIPSTPNVQSSEQLPKEFWMNEFVPQFANMIKTKKNTDRIKTYDIGNVFGVA